MGDEVHWAFGAALRTAREQLGLSGREAARRAGFSESRWRQLERGTQSVNGVEQPVSTRPETVLKTADVVNLDPRGALILAGFNPDDHFVTAELAAFQRRELLDLFEQLNPDRRTAVLNLLRAFSTTSASGSSH